MNATTFAQNIAANLARVEEQVAAACATAGRPRNGVAICAVSKTQPATAVAAAIEAGLTLFGENYVQETEKFAPFAAVHLHLIGHLQSNKVRKALARCQAIQTLDSAKLATTLEREWASLGTGQPLAVFIEVNVAGEASKSGVSREQAHELAGYVVEHAPHLRIAGLMTIAPGGASEGELRPLFASLRNLRDDLRRQLPPAHPCAELSMGMSDDFAAAIAEGATIIRLGRALFGARP